MDAKLQALLDRLFDPTIAFNDIDLSGVPSEDLIYIIQAVRAWGLMGKGHAAELSNTLSAIDQYTNRNVERTYIIAPGSHLIH